MNKKVIGICTTVLIIVLGGFIFTNFKPNKEENKNETISIKHELGEAKVIKNPKNVVVFDYGIVDSLNALGIDITALPKGDVLPSFLNKYKADKYKGVGSIKEPNMEKIFEIKPDLIIISGRQSKYYEEMNKIAPTIYLNIDSKDYIGSFKSNMNILGDIFDKKDEVSKEIVKIENLIKEVKDKATEKKANGLIILTNDSAFSVYGKDSRFGIIHKELGITPIDKTISDATHGQKASFEYIVEKNPEYIFVVDRAAVVGGEKSAKEIFENELVKKTQAYKNNNIIYLSADIWYTASGGFGTTKTMINEIKNALSK